MTRRGKEDDQRPRRFRSWGIGHNGASGRGDREIFNENDRDSILFRPGRCAIRYVAFPVKRAISPMDYRNITATL